MDRRLDTYLRVKSALKVLPIKVKNYNVNGVADAAGKWLKGTNSAGKWSAGDLAALGVGGLGAVGTVGLVHAITENNRRQKEIYDKLIANKVKSAAKVPFDKIKEFAEDLDEKSTLLDKARLKFFQGQSLGHGYNGNPEVSDDGKEYKHSTHSLKSRGRQIAALGLSGIGAAGGALGGYKLTKALTDKLGLGDEYDENGKKKKKGLGKRLAKAGLIAAGTLGAGAGGYALGTTAAGFMNGVPNDEEGNNITHVGEILSRPKYRKAIKDYVRDSAKENGAGPLETYLSQKAILDWGVPIKPW